MFLDNNFGKSLEILHRSMDVAIMRRRTISDNIANSDTPNFKRSNINFESELKRALDSEKATFFRAAVTDSRHISFRRVQDWREVSPRKVLDYLSTSKNNGNNVDIETESMMALQNQLSYDLMATSVTNQFRQISMVVQ